MQQLLQIQEFNAILSRHATRSSLGSHSVNGCVDSHAVISVGKKTMEELENIDLRRQLAMVGRSFPHSNETRKKDMPEKYLLLLELTHPNPRYPLAVQRHALNILVTQMYLGHTQILADALVCMPPPDIKKLLARLIQPHDPNREELPGYTLLDDFDFNAPNLTHLITFLTHAALLSPHHCYALFQGGMMDLLLCIHIYTPPNSVYGECVREACRRLAPCFDESRCEEFREHPFYALAISGDIQSRQLAFGSSGGEVDIPPYEACVLLSGRKEVWSSIPDTVLHRVAAIQSMLKDTMNLESWELWTALVDLLEFVDWGTFGTQVTSTSFSILCKAEWPRRQDVLSEIYDKYFTVLDPHRRSDVLRCLVKISKKPFERPDDPNELHDDLQRQRKPRKAIVHRMIPLFCTLALSNEQSRKDLIKAGVVQLVQTIAHPDISSPFFAEDEEYDFSETLRFWGLSRRDETAAEKIHTAANPDGDQPGHQVIFDKISRYASMVHDLEISEDFTMCQWQPTIAQLLNPLRPYQLFPNLRRIRILTSLEPRDMDTLRCLIHSNVTDLELKLFEVPPTQLLEAISERMPELGTLVCDYSKMARQYLPPSTEALARMFSGLPRLKFVSIPKAWANEDILNVLSQCQHLYSLRFTFTPGTGLGQFETLPESLPDGSFPELRMLDAFAPFHKAISCFSPSGAIPHLRSLNIVSLQEPAQQLRLLVEVLASRYSHLLFLHLSSFTPTSHCSDELLRTMDSLRTLTALKQLSIHHANLLGLDEGQISALGRQLKQLEVLSLAPSWESEVLAPRIGIHSLAELSQSFPKLKELQLHLDVSAQEFASVRSDQKFRRLERLDVGGWTTVTNAAALAKFLDELLPDGCILPYIHPIPAGWSTVVDMVGTRRQIRLGTL
ncbi:hypothetical protein ONZ45_g13214 [Pleurotus djamor]|nr:hypothetical protein ONZ45_g13214 [Pleurotus djamor]